MNLSGIWEQLLDCISRPPRDVYYSSEVLGFGEGKLIVGNTRVKREDIILVNKRAQRLKCSHFRPIDIIDSNSKRPCAIYCHCNSGSRREAEDAVLLLAPYGISVFAFDFSGSGNSDGDWVTLGAHEIDDLDCVIQHIREQDQSSMIALWGRSMGAVTALLYAAKDPQIQAIIVDSPFSKLTDLMLEIATQQQMLLPTSLKKMAIQFMRRSLKKRADFDIEVLNPIDIVDQIQIPILFLHSEEDSFVNIKHSKLLYDKYKGQKKIITFSGGKQWTNNNYPGFDTMLDEIKKQQYKKLKQEAQSLMPDLFTSIGALDSFNIDKFQASLDLPLDSVEVQAKPQSTKNNKYQMEMEKMQRFQSRMQQSQKVLQRPLSQAGSQPQSQPQSHQDSKSESFQQASTYPAYKGKQNSIKRKEGSSQDDDRQKISKLNVDNLLDKSLNLGLKDTESKDHNNLPSGRKRKLDTVEIKDATFATEDYDESPLTFKKQISKGYGGTDIDTQKNADHNFGEQDDHKDYVSENNQAYQALQNVLKDQGNNKDEQTQIRHVDNNKQDNQSDQGVSINAARESPQKGREFKIRDLYDKDQRSQLANKYWTNFVDNYKSRSQREDQDQDLPTNRSDKVQSSKLVYNGKYLQSLKNATKNGFKTLRSESRVSRRNHVSDILPAINTPNNDNELKMLKNSEKNERTLRSVGSDVNCYQNSIQAQELQNQLVKQNILNEPESDNKDQTISKQQDSSSNVNSRRILTQSKSQDITQILGSSKQITQFTAQMDEWCSNDESFFDNENYDNIIKSQLNGLDKQKLEKVDTQKQADSSFQLLQNLNKEDKQIKDNSPKVKISSQDSLNFNAFQDFKDINASQDDLQQDMDNTQEQNQEKQLPKQHQEEDTQKLLQDTVLQNQTPQKMYENTQIQLTMPKSLQQIYQEQPQEEFIQEGSKQNAKNSSDDSQKQQEDYVIPLQLPKSLQMYANQEFQRELKQKSLGDEQSTKQIDNKVNLGSNAQGREEDDRVVMQDCVPQQAAMEQLQDSILKLQETMQNTEKKILSRNQKGGQNQALNVQSYPIKFNRDGSSFSSDSTDRKRGSKLTENQVRYQNKLQDKLKARKNNQKENKDPDQSNQSSRTSVIDQTNRSKQTEYSELTKDSFYSAKQSPRIWRDHKHDQDQDQGRAATQPQQQQVQKSPQKVGQKQVLKSPKKLIQKTQEQFAIIQQQKLEQRLNKQEERYHKQQEDIFLKQQEQNGMPKLDHKSPAKTQKPTQKELLIQKLNQKLPNQLNYRELKAPLKIKQTTKVINDNQQIQASDIKSYHIGDLSDMKCEPISVGTVDQYIQQNQQKYGKAVQKTIRRLCFKESEELALSFWADTPNNKDLIRIQEQPKNNKRTNNNVRNLNFTQASNDAMSDNVSEQTVEDIKNQLQTTSSAQKNQNDQKLGSQKNVNGLNIQKLFQNSRMSNKSQKSSQNFDSEKADSFIYLREDGYYRRDSTLQEQQNNNNNYNNNNKNNGQIIKDNNSYTVYLREQDRKKSNLVNSSLKTASQLQQYGKIFQNRVIGGVQGLQAVFLDSKQRRQDGSQLDHFESTDKIISNQKVTSNQNKTGFGQEAQEWLQEARQNDIP